MDLNPDDDPGMGVFQNRDGTFDVHIVGVNIVSIEKQSLHPLQKRYAMESGYDGDFVICPTLQSIRAGDVPLPFRVNHSQFRPTHELVWFPHQFDHPHSHFILKGTKHVVSTSNGNFI